MPDTPQIVHTGEKLTAATQTLGPIIKQGDKLR